MAGMVSPPSPTLVSPPSQGRWLIHQVYTAHTATLATPGETMPGRGSGGLSLLSKLFFSLRLISALRRQGASPLARFAVIALRSGESADHQA